MAARVSERDLRVKVDNLNRQLGFTIDWEEPRGWHREVGSVRLAGAYGGYGVHQLANDAGGVHDLMYGYDTKRACADFLNGMRAALYLQQEDA